MCYKASAGRRRGPAVRNGGLARGTPNPEVPRRVHPARPRGRPAAASGLPDPGRRLGGVREEPGRAPRAPHHPLQGEGGGHRRPRPAQRAEGSAPEAKSSAKRRPADESTSPICRASSPRSLTFEEVMRFVVPDDPWWSDRRITNAMDGYIKDPATMEKELRADLRRGAQVARRPDRRRDPGPRHAQALRRAGRADPVGGRSRRKTRTSAGTLKEQSRAIRREDRHRRRVVRELEERLRAGWTPRSSTSRCLDRLAQPARHAARSRNRFPRSRPTPRARSSRSTAATSSGRSSTPASTPPTTRSRTVNGQTSRVQADASTSRRIRDIVTPRQPDGPARRKARVAKLPRPARRSSGRSRSRSAAAQAGEAPGDAGGRGRGQDARSTGSSSSSSSSSTPTRARPPTQPRHPRRGHPRRQPRRARRRQRRAGAGRRRPATRRLGGRHVPRHPALRLPGAGADAEGDRVRDHRRAPVHPLHQRAQQLHDDPRRQPEPVDPARRPQLRLRAHAGLQRMRAAGQQRRRRRRRGGQPRLSELRDQRTACTRATPPSASPIPATPTA